MQSCIKTFPITYHNHYLILSAETRTILAIQPELFTLLNIKKMPNQRNCSGCNRLSINLRTEENRLGTFTSVFLGPGAKQFLAQQGFYFYGNGLVCCQFCGVILEVTGRLDKDAITRQHLQVDCDLMHKRPCGNVPLLPPQLPTNTKETKVCA